MSFAKNHRQGHGVLAEKPFQNWSIGIGALGRIKNKSHSALNRGTNPIGIKLCMKLVVGVELFRKIKTKHLLNANKWIP